MKNDKRWVEVKDLPGKNKGVVAIEDIPKGTRIITETPLIKLPTTHFDLEERRREIRQQISSLSDSDVSRLRSMAWESGTATDVTSIVTSIWENSYVWMYDDLGGLFTIASRLNHSCCHNAIVAWNHNTKVMNVQVIHDVNQGDEITVNYLASVYTRKIRQQLLREGWGFICRCSFCSLSDHENKLLEKKQVLFNMMKKDIANDELLQYIPVATLWASEKGIEIAKDLHQSPSHFLFHGGLAFLRNSDVARATILFTWLLDALAIEYGFDSPQYLSKLRYRYHPKDRAEYGDLNVVNWQSEVLEVFLKDGEDFSDFEMWLWRKELRNPMQDEALEIFLASPDSSFDTESYPQALKEQLQAISNGFKLFEQDPYPPASFSWYKDLAAAHDESEVEIPMSTEQRNALRMLVSVRQNTWSTTK